LSGGTQSVKRYADRPEDVIGLLCPLKTPRMTKE
jgi:hypothetical protein